MLHSSSVARRWPCSLSSRGPLCATTCPPVTHSHLGALVPSPRDPETCPGTSLGSAGSLPLGKWGHRVPQVFSRDAHLALGSGYRPYRRG